VEPANGQRLTLGTVRRQRSKSVGQTRAITLIERSLNGGFIGGPLSDRVGPRRVIVWSLIAAVPFMAAAPRLSPVGFTAMLAIGGLLLQSTLPISVTFAQTFVKGGAATVSSLMMGFAWGMGSLAVPLIGAGADRFGIENTLAVLAFLPLVAAALAAGLPSTGAARDESVPPVEPLP